MSHPARVFIIDDNVLVRFALSELLNQEPDIVVVGDAALHKQLLKEIKTAKPDILIFDIPLPRDKTINRLKPIKTLRLPSIVFTKSDASISRDLIELLSIGVTSVVLKPDKDEDIDQIRDQLLYEIRLNTKRPQPKPSKLTVSYLHPLRAVAIGSSTGGPEALFQIVPQFPPNFEAGVVIVQHMPPDFTTRFASRLNNNSSITVKEAQTGDVLKSGLVLLAPGDYHLKFALSKQDNKRLAKAKLTKDPPQWKLRPTVDNMMISLAPIYGPNLIGVILTGMGEDGVIGMRAIKNYGGKTLVQNKRTSVVFGMAQEVIKNNLADEILPLEEIVPRIIQLIKA